MIREFKVLRLVLNIENWNLEQAIEVAGKFHTEVGCWTAMSSMRIQEGYDYFYINLKSSDLKQISISRLMWKLVSKSGLSISNDVTLSQRTD
jgi:hypothetical protein